MGRGGKIDAVAKGRWPADDNPLADVGLEIRAVLTKAQDADNIPAKLHPGNERAQRLGEFDARVPVLLRARHAQVELVG